jgi:hypothetical protein
VAKKTHVGRCNIVAQGIGHDKNYFTHSGNKSLSI